MIANTFTRSTAPHLESLAATLTPLLAVANAGSFHLSFTGSHVVIAQGGWDGVNLTSVQTAVTNAPNDSETLTAKFEADRIPPMFKAAFIVVLDGVNIERARHGAAAITPAQFVTQIKQKLDTL
jgi:hypothetical protein